MTASAALATTEPTEIPSPVVPYVTANPITVLLDSDLRDRFFGEIEAEIGASTVDLTTETGRKAVASLAYKIARTKTAIDDAGKALTEEWRAKTKVVNDARAIARDKLDDLRDKARKPLTDWESAEKERAEKIEATIKRFDEVAVVPAFATGDMVAGFLDEVRQTLIDEEVFREFTTRALAGRKAAIEALEAGLARIRQEEADRAELAKLRAEREERERVERERQEAEERARREAEEAEARRVEVERLAAEQVAAAERKAEEARLAAARAEEERIAAVAAAEARAVEAAAKAKADAEREALARKEQAEKEAAAAKAQEEADKRRREEDIAHKSKILGEVKDDLMGLAQVQADNVPEGAIKAIVRAIHAGFIRHTSIEF